MADADSLIGTIRRFGEFGPVYEVLGRAFEGRTDPCLRICVVESGEELDYPIADISADPLAE